MRESAAVPSYPCRTVTAAEVAHYQEYGWAKLKGFVHAEIVQQLLSTARQRMGEDGDSTEGISQPYFTVGYSGGFANPPVRALIEGVGKSASQLMRRRAGLGVRYFSDFFAPKLPAKKQTRNAGNGPTSFHQDFITFAVDRSGGMTFWLALEDYGPEFGTMSFVNRSHHMGVIGSYRTYGEGDALDVYPECRELGLSEAMSYAAGDVTVHSHLTVHGGGANLTDRPRWAYIMLVQPADICWNGAPSEAFDCSGMKPNQALDDARFPLIG
jgi:hypothetical protein